MSETYDKDELLRLPGRVGRKRTIRILAGKLDKNGAPYLKEHIVLENDQEGLLTVEIVETRTCSFGHTIDDQTRVAGICEIGSEVLCSREGCMLKCVTCGAVVCCRHSKTYGEKTYCSRHWPLYWWRKFWGLE
jgi:hypothetical protein